jgi:hypothetical protein
MRRRVRWGNVGRVAGAVAVVALVVAWPRLGGDPLVAPGGVVVPLATPNPSDPPAPPRAAPRRRVVPTPTATAQIGKPRKPARSRRARRAKPRHPAPPAGVRVTPRVAATPAQPVAPAPQAPTRAAPRPPAPTIDPAEREFGFER